MLHRYRGFFFSSRRRHTMYWRDWSSDVCSSDLIVLAAAEGLSSTQVATDLGVSVATVRKWRNRFAVDRLDGLPDEPRPGRPRTLTDQKVDEVVTKTLESAPRDATHWSTRSMAREAGLTQTAVHDIWQAFGLNPTGKSAGNCRETRSLPPRSETSSACTSIRPSGPWSWPSRRSPRSKPWIAPGRRCRCSPAPPSGPPTTTNATAPAACTPRWTSP